MTLFFRHTQTLKEYSVSEVKEMRHMKSTINFGLKMNKMRPNRILCSILKNCLKNIITVNVATFCLFIYLFTYSCIIYINNAIFPVISFLKFFDKLFYKYVPYNSSELKIDHCYKDIKEKTQ